LIEHGATGLLVPPDDPARLSQAIGALICDPARRAALGAAGERRVRGNFAMQSGIDALAMRFGLPGTDREAVGPQATPLPLDTRHDGEDPPLGVGHRVLVPEPSGK